MGLLDVLNGMANGPRGQTDPNAKGGMSPITMAILALLAYKGIKHLSADHAPAPGGSAPAPSSGGSGGGLAGGLGDIIGGMLNGPRGAATTGGASVPDLGGLLKGGLGGLFAGGAAGSILSGGLGSLLNQFQQQGHGEAANSWVGTGPNRDISESDMAKSIGVDDIEALAQHTGLSSNDLLVALRRELPGVIDGLTPNGRLPTGDEIVRRA